MRQLLLSLSLIFLSGFATPDQTSAQDFPGAGKVSKVHGGFKFTEGPAFDGKHLYFTDIPNNRILRTDLKGTLETFLENSGNCNGLMFDGKNSLIACRMGRLENPVVDAELIAIDVTTKQVKSLSSKYDGKRYNACNDLVIDKSGGPSLRSTRTLAASQRSFLLSIQQRRSDQTGRRHFGTQWYHSVAR